ncbi:hypothetical protein ACHQM5_016665 [Ranunculus cassubicifolius]
MFVIERCVTGHTPINCAVRGGFYEIVVYLLEKGANPDIPSNTGVTPLHWAAVKEDVKILQLLLSRGVNVDAFSNDGTALQWAEARRNHRAVNLLLDCHDNVSLFETGSSGSMLESATHLVKGGILLKLHGTTNLVFPTIFGAIIACEERLSSGKIVYPDLSHTVRVRVRVRVRQFGCGYA